MSEHNGIDVEQSQEPSQSPESQTNENKGLFGIIEKLINVRDTFKELANACHIV